jgi:hypothetical protein
MTTPPDDIDAMFDLEPLPAAAEPTAQAAEAEAAALAAEIALTLESGGVAADAPDSRSKLRVEVSWPARMRLPGGRVVQLKVRNVSEGGVGLTSAEDIPAYTVVDFEMDVPHPDEDGLITPVEGAIKTNYTVAQGSAILCGGTWQAPPAGLELVRLWIDRLEAGGRLPT